MNSPVFCNGPVFNKGIHISLEGIDGAGKTTQLSCLLDWFTRLGIAYIATKSPSSSLIGNVLRSALNRKIDMDQRTLALLFTANILYEQERSGGIIEVLENGTNVLSDRYFLSTYAYQMLSCDLQWLHQINRFCRPPDITFYFDISPNIAIERLRQSRGEQLELFEEVNFLTQIKENYDIAIRHLRSEGQNIEKIRIDDGETVESVQNRIRLFLGEYIHV